MTMEPPETAAVRWMPPDAETLTAFRELRGQISSTLKAAADLCAQLGCFTVPADDYGAPIEIVRGEQALHTVGLARAEASRVLENAEPQEMLKRMGAAVFLTACLLQTFDAALSSKPARDA